MEQESERHNANQEIYGLVIAQLNYGFRNISLDLSASLGGSFHLEQQGLICMFTIIIMHVILYLLKLIIALSD